MRNNILFLIIVVALLAGCTSKQEKACQEEYGRGGTATYEKTKQVFRDKYYQQCMDRLAP